MPYYDQKLFLTLKWSPFPKELKKKLLEMYGKEPLPYTWTEQDIHEGSRKIIIAQYNFIKRQVDLIKDSYKKNSDPSVIKTVRELANAQILELFPHAAREHVEKLDLSKWKTDA